MNRHRHLEYPDCSLYDFLAANAYAYAAYPALDYFGRKLSYQQMLSEIDICAAALSALGIRNGDAVSICLPNIPEAIYAFYAVNKIGAIANMIHPMSAEKELCHALNLSESRVVIALDLVGGRLSRILADTGIAHVVLVSVKESMPPFLRLAYAATNRMKQNVPAEAMSWKQFLSLAKKVEGDMPHHGRGDDCAAILYSGGTTGSPKGIMLSNLNFNALALQSIDGCGCLEKGDRVLSVMPIFHGFGLGVCIHTVLNFGGTAVILPKFKANEFHKLLFRCKPQIIAGVPAIYESFIRSKALDGRELSFLKCVISGGDSLSPSTKQKLNQLLADHGCRCTVREGYGLTECVTGSCLIPDHSDKLESVGLPYADTYYMIADPESGEPLPYGETGEIVLRGPTVMMGYLKEPEETANTLKTHSDGHTWLHTGDMGYMDEDGYVYFCQRLKRMIISGGYNIYPQVIENVINADPAVLMCAVIGIPDDILGQRAKAYVVLQDAAADKEQVRAALAVRMEKEIARYAQPREIVFVKSLPRTLVGKIAYQALAACEEE